MKPCSTGSPRCDHYVAGRGTAPRLTSSDKGRQGIWSLLKRSIADFAAADVDGLVRIIKRKLKKIQYRPHLIDGCLAGTGLKIDPGDHMHYEFNLASYSGGNVKLPDDLILTAEVDADKNLDSER